MEWNELTSLRALVRKHIVSGISSGQLCPGDKISEQGIADALGVSRTPTREALLQLNSEGLLDYFPRRGFAIRQMTEQEKRELYEMVAALDAYCARCAAPLLGAEEFRAMHELADKIDIAIKYQNLDEYRELQHKFHEIYRRKYGNETILRQLENAESGIVPQTFEGGKTDELMQLYTMLNNEHRQILALFEARDVDGVVRYLLETHWSLRYLQYTEPRRHPGVEPPQ